MNRTSWMALLLMASMAAAVDMSPEVKNIGIALDEIQPYVTLNTDYSIQFNAEKALAAGVAPSSVEIGREYVAYHNPTINTLRKHGSGTVSDQKIKAKFEGFFQAVAQTGALSGKALALNENEGQYSTMPGIPQLTTLVCGGDQQHPHFCPYRVESGVYRSSLNELGNHLRNVLGYHNTYWPGCGSDGHVCPRDFTRWVNAYSCNTGQFRSQAYARQVGNQWTYWTQTPEPNPEIFSYTWPVYWWGTYVQWWHGQC